MQELGVFPIIAFLSARRWINRVHTLESNKEQEGTLRHHFSGWFKITGATGLLTHFTGASSEWPASIVSTERSSTRPICIPLTLLKPIMVHKMRFLSKNPPLCVIFSQET